MGEDHDMHESAHAEDPIRLTALDVDAILRREEVWAPVPAAVEAAVELGRPHGGVVTGHPGGSVLAGLHDPDGIEIRLYPTDRTTQHPEEDHHD
ncbi:hypothetical protein [Dactylosporangium sp. NPDC050588]|uniref:hypothetical protein n=1 Tax=Dactylosporangium sp. NPDC050588 TaxID=3157211 RepID=UPI0033E0E152